MYSISEIAKMTELTARALRYYEEVGLIAPTRRGNNGYRYYSQEIYQRILEIKKFTAQCDKTRPYYYPL